MMLSSKRNICAMPDPVETFVASEMGAEQLRLLQAISRGGANNFKGNRYEQTLAAIKACELAARHSCENLNGVSLSTQAMAFVDDLCIENKLADTKVNYQAKNSSGNAAEWSADLKQRFELQRKLDLDHHKYKVCKQVLVVSSSEKFSNNLKKIDELGVEGFCVEYIPYKVNELSLIRDYDPLRKALIALAIDSKTSTLDYIFKMMQGSWIHFSYREKVSLADVISHAKSLSKPDFFRADVVSMDVPDWIKNLCGSVQGLKAELKYGVVEVEYKGLTLMLGSNPGEPIELKQHASAGTQPEPGQVMALLASCQSL